MAEQMRGIELPEEYAVDLLGDVLLSVQRDIAIGKRYGYNARDASSGTAYPPASTVFTAEYAKALNDEVAALDVVDSLSYPLFTGKADLIGNLAKLLVFVRESDRLKEYVERADNLIHGLGVERLFMNDQQYLRHLRNAVLHGRVGVELDTSNPWNTKLVFLDVDMRGPDVTAKLVMNAEDLLKVVRIIIHEVYEKYLRDVGWSVPGD